MSFLMGLGIEEMLAAMDPEGAEYRAALHLLKPEGMGRTFKVLIQHKGIDRPELDGLKFRPFFGSALVPSRARGEGPEATGSPLASGRTHLTPSLRA
jgi:hypothetical protein